MKNSALEAQKFDFRVSTVRSRRLPQFQFAVLGGELMHSFDFTFPAGAFGTYASTGPVPGAETKIRTPARLATLTTASINEPLIQQYKIGLGIRAAKLGRDIAREDVRAERQKTAADARNAYFNLIATQSGIEAAAQAVKTLEEAQRVTARYAAEMTVLRADALEVDARLAKARYELSVAENGMATQREHLNELLGRDLTTPFRVELMPEVDTSDLTLDAARESASQKQQSECGAILYTEPSDRVGRSACNIGLGRIWVPEHAETQRPRHPGARCACHLSVARYFRRQSRAVGDSKDRASCDRE